METIAFLGLGRMGFPMAARCLAAGLPVTVWNRTAKRAEPLQTAGALQAPTPADAAREASIVITMLTDAAAVESVLFDPACAAALSPGTIVVDMSSTYPTVARDHAARLAQRGVQYVDAPVSGGTAGATAGTLAIMAGADPATFARLAPILSAMGTPHHVGPVGCGQLAKLANQIIVAVTVAAVAEALVLAERGGADPAAVRDAMHGGFADSRILAEQGQRMVTGNFAPGGVVNNQIKDLVAATAAAREAGLDLSMLSAARELFERLRDHGGGELDHSAIFLEIQRGVIENK